MSSQCTQLETYYTARGLPRFEVQVTHPELNKIQVIRGDDAYIVQQKAIAKMAQWDEMWAKRFAAEERRRNREASLALAEERTAEAQALHEELRGTLHRGLATRAAIDWEALKDNARFHAPRPAESRPLREPARPDPNEARFQSTLTFLDKVFPGRAEKKRRETRDYYKRVMASWEKDCATIRARMAQREKNHRESMLEWQLEKDLFEGRQQEGNAAVDREREDYLGKKPEAVSSYCDLVLTRSRYPVCLPNTWDLEFNEQTGTLVIDYQLPAPVDIPSVKEVRYVQSRDELVEKTLSTREFNQLYDGLLYQIALRTVHELFDSDVIDMIRAVAFNGIVHTIDPGTGAEADSCILTLQTTKEEFQALNLSLVEPRDCFKQLKGIGSAKLHALAAVAPIMTIQRDDRRFVESYDVAATLSAGDNLAAMDWEDFEHLVRELFQLEFAATGSEVKVTQASRDGGVDAVIFDRDPVKGGRIVVQAKRYTNTVDVAAVRDLYGTVINEGAMKGILVTTADYGPDSYGFAKDKPLTLLNGSNLLHLLQKHGRQARIDLKEAKAQQRNEQD